MWQMIIFTANINDRSMTGVRDSEVAIKFEDNEMVRNILRAPIIWSSFIVSLLIHVLRLKGV